MKIFRSLLPVPVSFGRIRKFRLLGCMFLLSLLSGGVALAQEVVPGTESHCEQTVLAPIGMSHFHSAAFITKTVVLDTSASLLHGRVENRVSGNLISGASVTFTQGKEIYRTSTNRKGEFEFYGNQFTGSWRIRIEGRHFECLELKDLRMGGGIWATFRLQKQ